MIRAEKATIVERSVPGVNHVRLRLHVPGIASESRPGQFVNVRCTPLSFGASWFDDPQALIAARRKEPRRMATLLQRPFAVHRTQVEGPDAGHIEILFKIVGPGTRALSEVETGEELELLGPLGTGFDLDWARRLSTAIVVAGGVGVAPLYPLVEYLREQNVHTIVLVGALCEEDLPLETADSRVALSFMATRPEVLVTAEDFVRMGCTVGIVTLEGKRGYIGLPTEMFDRFLHSSDSGARGEAGVFTCGPRAMMREVARHAREHDVRCQVLLEERMACGVGACMACSCRMLSPDGTVVRKRVCLDGPVFDASEVIWDET